MRKLASKAVILLCVGLFPAAAVAGVTMTGPSYIGSRSANPEQETFGYLVTEVSEQQLAFLGPARSMGVVTGDDEKDTVAYRTMLGIMVNEHWSFQLEW